LSATDMNMNDIIKIWNKYAQATCGRYAFEIPAEILCCRHACVKVQGSRL